MRSIRRAVTGGGWVAPTWGIVRVVPGAILEDRYGGDVTHKVRDPIDRIIAWGVSILAIVLAVGYQLLPRMDAIAAFARRRGS